LLATFHFELVVYDEIEKFRDYDHDIFNYPYEARKTKLASFTLNTRDFELGKPDESGNYVDGFITKTDYEYSSRSVKF
jgi:hypothetical protein